jgi:ribosome-binding factor A
MAQKKKTKSGEPTQRQLRVGEELRHALADIFIRGEAYIQSLEGMSITVSEVRLSPDLKHANAYVMPLGGGSFTKEVITKLNEHAPYFRHLVAGRLHLRFIPKVSFRPDDSFDEAQKISTLMNLPHVRKDIAGE